MKILKEMCKDGGWQEGLAVLVGAVSLYLTFWLAYLLK